MTQPVVHLYALVWNEMALLPFFLDHYRSFVDKFYLFDDGSDDGSCEYLAEQPDVVLSRFDSAGDSFVAKARQFYCDAWKASRGHADYVVVVNIDELVHNPDPRAALSLAREEKATVIDTRGWEMIGDSMPTCGPLWKTVPHGVHSKAESKIAIFDPEAIREINYGPGRHTAKPEGRVRGYNEPIFDLLHYKYLSADYLVERYRQLGERMRAGDIASQYGTHYQKTEEELRAEHARLRAAAVPVLPLQMKAEGLVEEPRPGAFVTKLRRVTNDKGSLREVWRIDDALTAQARQAYLTTTPPNVVKAWYKHQKQTDQITPVSGRGRLVLLDTRTEGREAKPVIIDLDADDPVMVVIPPAVWHGFQAIGESPLTLLHLNDRAFDHVKTDELRISPDDPVIPYRWPEGA